MVALWSRHWNRHHGQKSKSLRSVSQSIMSSMTVVWFRRVSHVAINQDYGKGAGEQYADTSIIGELITFGYTAYAK